MNLFSSLTFVISLISIASCAPPTTPENNNNLPANSNDPQAPKKAPRHVNFGNFGINEGNVANNLESKFDEVSTSNESKKRRRIE